MKKYWAILSHWSLIDSMATESISPYSFYMERCFGSDLSRYIDGSERINHIVLYATEPVADIAVELSESLLEPQSLCPVGKGHKVFTYPKTIVFRKGEVRFRFSSDVLLKTILSETEIMLEVKCTRLYRDDFYVSVGGTPVNKELYMDCLPLERQDESIVADDRRNYVKGAIMGFVRGSLTSHSESDRTLLNALADLKNSFGGQHTKIMIDCTYHPIASLMNKIESVEELYVLAGHRRKSNFEVIKHIYIEVIDIAKKRYEALKSRKILDRQKQADQFEVLARQCEMEMSRIMNEGDLSKVVDELNIIKSMEVARGREVGKSRLYFKKGTPEYIRKLELKAQIEDFKKNNEQYNELDRKCREYKRRKTELMTDSTEYDGAISPAFLKISDVVSSITADVSRISSAGTVDLSPIDVTDGRTVVLRPGCGYSVGQVEFFNILLESILDNPLKELRPVSDMDVMKILQISCKRYKDECKTFDTDEGQKIKDIVNSFWKYRKHDPSGNIVLDPSMPLLSAAIAFFVKCQDFSQIERYSENKGIGCKPYSLMLWSALVGFASLPRTMTDEIYSDLERYRDIQNILKALC